MDMDTSPIEITIKDDALYTYLALILDQEAVREQIFKLRNEYGNRVKPPALGLNMAIAKTLKDLHLPVTLFDPIKQAVTEGKVTTFKRVQRIVIPRETLIDLYVTQLDTLQDGNYEYAVITPVEATQEEVLAEFRELNQVVSDSVTKVLPITYAYHELIQSMGNTISNIKRDRVWYWKRKQEMSYREIAIEDNKGGKHYKRALTISKKSLKCSEQDLKEAVFHLKHIEDAMETIRKAVKQYESRLKQLTPET